MVESTWPRIEEDALGYFAAIEVDRSVFNDTVICKTAYWFTDRYYVYIKALDQTRVLVELREKQPSSSNLRDVAGDFCNSLLDYRVRESVLDQTRAIREALINKAFSEGAITPGIHGAGSNEKRIPAADADYHQDPVRAGKFDA